MVVRLFCLFCFYPLLLISAEFTASVSRNHVNMGDSLTLNLTLKNGSAKGAPAIGALNQVFHIHSQQHYNNTAINNGKVTSSTTWKYTLSPKTEEDIVIPPINIQTSDGMASTQPITIKVNKGNSSNQAADDSGINLAYDVSNAKPFKNEPFVYTIKLSSRKELSNIQAQKFTVEDAIIESHGEPKVYSKVMNGIPMGIIEFSYLITPLKPGLLKIPGTLIQGLVPSEQRAQRRSIFDDEFDPFTLMQGFDRLKPFAITTEKIELNVQPPVADMTPWLPARSLIIEEIFDTKKPIQAGEPFTRIFNMTAIGLKSSQLPSLQELQTADSRVKIYADKPEFKDESSSGTISGFRREQYTFIPQEEGSLTLPEITIAWWDVAKKEKAIAIVPSRTIQVLPGTAHSPKDEVSSLSTNANESVPQNVERDPILYIVIAGLTVLLGGAVMWMIVLQKKIGQLTNPASKSENLTVEKYNPFAETEARTNTKNKKGKLNDLNPT